MSDVAKMNAMVSREETKINNTYYQIGKLYVTMHLYDYEEEFAEMISIFAQAEEKIRNYRQQIQDIKGVICCSECDASVAGEVFFCVECGMKL